MLVQALDLVGELQGLGRVHAGGRLVEQQQLRAARRARGRSRPAGGWRRTRLDTSMVGARQQPVAEQREDLERACSRAASSSRRVRGSRSTAPSGTGAEARMHADQHVFEHGQVAGTGGCSGRCGRCRARASDAAAARRSPRRRSGSSPRSGGDQAGDGVEQGRLARAVRPDHRDDRLRRHGRGRPSAARPGRRTARSARDFEQRRRSPRGSTAPSPVSRSKPPRPTWARLLARGSAPAPAASPGSALAAIQHHRHQDDAEDQLDRLTPARPAAASRR